MELELLYFNCCICMLRLGFQELPTVTQALTLLSAALRMLRLHLVLERLIFSISLLPQCIEKTTTAGSSQFYDFEYRKKV